MAAEAEAEVSPLIFGQFLEIASWGERGPEAYADEQTGELPEAVVEKPRELHAPIIRFPAGSDLPSLLWTDRVTLPGRPEPPTSKGNSGLPLTNRFTYDHFLRLCRELEAEPLVVVKAMPGVSEAMFPDEPGERHGDGGTLEETAQQAADLVAYLNAELTPGMDPRVQRFAALRAANGRLEPWGVKTFQVGNELFMAMRRRSDDRLVWGGAGAGAEGGAGGPDRRGAGLGRRRDAGGGPLHRAGGRRGVHGPRGQPPDRLEPADAGPLPLGHQPQVRALGDRTDHRRR